MKDKRIERTLGQEKEFKKGEIKMLSNSKNKPVDHTQEVTKIWQRYNREILNSKPVNDSIEGNIYENIARHKQGYQSEILDIMYSEGYKKALKDHGIKK